MMPKRILTLFFLLAFLLPQMSKADVLLTKVWNPRLLLARPQPKGDFKTLVIPLKRANNLILVEANVDGVQGYFILDTGAPYLVLNSTYFRQFKIERENMASGIDGQMVEQKTLDVEKLTIRDLYYEELTADVIDLSTIENKRGVKILGLLGVNLWLKLQLDINIKQSTLTLWELNRKGETLSPSATAKKAAQYVFDFRLRNGVILLKSSINGHTLFMGLDTGAETCVLSNDLPSVVFEAVEITDRKQLYGAGGTSVEVLFGNLLNLDVGCPVKGSKVIIANLSALGKSYGISIDGIIGFDLLNQGQLSLNFRKKEITLQVL